MWQFDFHLYVRLPHQSSRLIGSFFPGSALGSPVRVPSGRQCASFDDAVGSVEAGDSAAVITLGGLNGSVEAGSDAVVVACAALSGSIAAGRDLALYAHGDVTGDLQAGRDVAVWTYGDMDADLHAQRDVLQLWARGDVTGAVIADRNIGWDDWSAGYSDAHADVFSHGSISATIQALNPDNLIDGGHIGRVVAAGGIGGGIHAASAIQQVRCGDAITAVLSAPLVGSVVEHDATIAVEFPYPDLPPTFLDQLLAEAADAYDHAAGWRSLLEDALNDAVADLAAARAELAVELDEQRAFVDAGRDEQLARRTALKAEGLSESDAERSALRSQLHLFLDRLRQDAEALVSDATAARDAASTQRNAGYAAAIQSTQSLREQLLEYDDELAQTRDESLQESAERRAAREAAFTTAVKDVLPRPGAPRYSPSFLDEHPQLREFGNMITAAAQPVPAILHYGTLSTSLRAIGNAVTDALVSTITIGFVDDLELFGGADDPYYDYAYYPARISSELILTFGTYGLGVGVNGKGLVDNLSRVAKPLDGVADSAGALGNRADVVEDVAGAIAPGSEAARHYGGAVGTRLINHGFGLSKLGSDRLRNCLYCAIATDSTWAGRAATALPRTSWYPRTFADGLRSEERWVGNGKTFTSSSLSDIRSAISGSVGNRGIVVGMRADGTSHAFNVINKNGKVHFFDGQANAAIKNLDEFKNLYFLPTNF